MLGTPYPRAIPVDVVVGAPIDVEKNTQYTLEDVDRLHSQYIDSLIELYNKHKDIFGSSTRQLIIIDAE